MPPDAIQKRVVPPSSLNDTASCVRIEGEFENASVPEWPLRCEGNLAPPAGGTGTGGPPPHWSAKIANAKVKIVDILGGRVNTLGNFSQETNAHNPMRLFVDTRENWDGGDLVPEQYDKQRVKVVVEVIPATLDVSKYYILWEAYDPDDPADHSDIDSSPKGGDNGGKDHEGDAHWWTKADHDFLPGSAPTDTDVAKNDRDEKTVLGTAKTVIVSADGKNLSSAFFNFSDQGGDNFVIRAVLMLKEGDKAVGDDKTDVLTVWRKYDVITYAAVKCSDAAVLDPLPDATRLALFKGAFGRINDGAATANKNCYIDIAVHQATGKVRVGSIKEKYNLINGDKVNVKVNAGNLVEKTYNFATSGQATAAEVRDLMNTISGITAFLMDDDKRVILEADSEIEFEHKTSSDYGIRVIYLYPNAAPGNRRFTAFRVPDVAWAAGDETSVYALYYTNFHVGDGRDGHRDYTLQLMGWWQNSTSDKLGATIAPHSHVAYSRHKVNGQVNLDWIAKTAIHEVGHSIYTQGDNDYHNTHTDGFADCVANGTGGANDRDHFCPRHVLNLRKAAYRAWSTNHQPN